MHQVQSFLNHILLVDGVLHDDLLFIRRVFSCSSYNLRLFFSAQDVYAIQIEGGCCLGFFSCEIISEDEQLHLLDSSGCCDYNADYCIDSVRGKQASKQLLLIYIEKLTYGLWLVSVGRSQSGVMFVVRFSHQPTFVFFVGLCLSIVDLQCSYLFKHLNLNVLIAKLFEEGHSVAAYVRMIFLLATDAKLHLVLHDYVKAVH